MAGVSDKPWGSFSASDYTPEQYCSAALVDNNPSGKPKTKDNCHLPVKEPSGVLNRNGIHAAASRIAGTHISPADKAAAARKLRALYSRIGETPPDNVRRLAGG